MTLDELTQKLVHVHPLSKISTAYWLYEKATEIGEKGLIIEIGVWAGFTAIAMALGGPFVYAVDTFDGRDRFTSKKALESLMGFYQLNYAPTNTLPFFLSNVEKAGLSGRLCEVVRPSVEAVSLFEPNTADLIFLDGDHERDAIRDDLQLWSRILKPGGILAVDNYKGIGEVKQETDRFIQDSQWPVAIAFPDCGAYTIKTSREDMAAIPPYGPPCGTTTSEETERQLAEIKLALGVHQEIR